VLKSLPAMNAAVCSDEYFLRRHRISAIHQTVRTYEVDKEPRTLTSAAPLMTYSSMKYNISGALGLMS
jgi:hypothetical protein